MTPAMQKIVEAMRAELARQSEESGQHYIVGEGYGEQGFESLDGNFDMEGLARAALLAVRVPDDGMLAGGEAADRAADPFIGTEHEGVPADPADAADHWRFMIDAILGEQP